MNEEKILEIKDKSVQIIHKYFADFDIFKKNSNFNLFLDNNTIKIDGKTDITYNLYINKGFKIDKPLKFTNLVNGATTDYTINTEISLSEIIKMLSTITKIPNICVFNNDDFIIYNGKKISYLKLQNCNNIDIRNSILQDVVWGEEIYIIDFNSVIDIINKNQQLTFIKRKIIPPMGGLLLSGLLLSSLHGPSNDKHIEDKPEPIKKIKIIDFDSVKFNKSIALYKENLLLSKILKQKNQFNLEEAFQYIEEIHILDGKYYFINRNLLKKEQLETISISLDELTANSIIKDEELKNYFSLGINSDSIQLIDSLKEIEVENFSKNESNIKYKISKYLKSSFSFNENLTLENIEITNSELFQLLMFIKTHNIYIEQSKISYLNKDKYLINNLVIKL